jgi:CO/xanthine dehydrogenase Mo-binding subunit
LGTTPDQLEAKDKRIFIKDSPDKGVSFLWAVKDYRDSGKPMPLIGRGYYEPPTEDMDTKTGEGNVSIAYGFGAQVAEVEVDIETGKVAVLRVTSANDCGKALNPLILNSESEGGISMGLGTALFEEISYDEKGGVLETSFSDYRLPSVWQQPEVRTIWVETVDPYGPYGAKGITEVVSLPTAAAIANAIYDAIGVRIRKLPMLPWKILDALKEEKSKMKA